jgi:genome
MKTLMPKVDTRDGLFHNGNPAIGEQGTQVKDVWLNDVQESLRDIQAEAHYVLKMAGFKPVENQQTQLYDSIVKIIGKNRKTATTTDKGEVKLNSATNSLSETEAATPKAVKEAFDNANNRVSKAGDEMFGNLRASGFSAKENYGAFEIFNSNETLRIEKEAQNFKFWRRMPGKSDVANYMPLTSGRLALEDDVNRKVSKSGDDIQWLNVKRGHAWLNITSTSHGSSGIDFTNSNGRYAQASIEAVDIGGWANELRLHATPTGENYDTDRRQHIVTFSPIGDVWTKTYGWLHEFYAKQSDNNNIWAELNNTYRKSRFGYRWYPNHYEGAQVIDIPTSDNSVIRITTMGVTIEGTQTINLPEQYNGFTKVVATDVGAGRRAVGIRLEGSNKLVIDNGYQTGLNIIVIGHFGW